MESLRQLAKECLEINDVKNKITMSFDCHKKLQDGLLSIDSDELLNTHDIIPGRPLKPEIVLAELVPKRGFGNMKDQAALFHAIAHIEFNAINLAWDAVSRFNNMPDQYYKDWAKVGQEEALHFCMLKEHLNKYGYDYGDFAAHDGLWQMAERTKQDPLVRMAMVPRVLEARGLDVTPGMIKKFENIGDDKAVKMLSKIYEDEIGHVKIGSRWFNYLCQQRSLDSKDTFRELIGQYFPDGLRGPFNLNARQDAGFSSSELSWLKNI